MEMRNCSPGLDRELWKLQVNFLAIVLEFCLETSIRKFYVTSYVDHSARDCWFAVKAHYFTSSLVVHASNDILTKLQRLDINTFSKQLNANYACR